MDISISDNILFTKQAQLDRILCQRSLYYLCKEVLGYKDMVPHIHGEFADFWTSPIYGRYRQATLPRSFFKTWVGTVGMASWLTLPDEEGLYKDIFPWKGANARGLIASNVIDNAAKMIFKIKQEWMQNERLRNAFPELLPDFNKTRWSDHVAEVKRTLKATEGTYTAVGAGGSVISQHFDYIIEDDLIYARKDDFSGVELMPSQEDIDNAIGWHKLSYSLLADPGTGCIFNLGTRWAPQDIIWYIRTFEKSYKIFEICAETDESNPDWYGHGLPVWPERYTTEVLKHIWATQGNKIYACFAAGSPILMSDFTCKTIENIHVGDELVGFTNGSGTGNGKLVRATVNLTESSIRDVVKITLASGKVIKCTADHPWYQGRCDKTHKPYLPAKVGRKLLLVHDYTRKLSEQELSDYKYLAGIIDGEGACNHGNIAIAQCKEANPDVYARIEEVIQRLGISYNIGKFNPDDTHTLGKQVIKRGTGTSFVLNGGRQLKGDIIRYGNPAKTPRILKTIWDKPHGVIHGEDAIVSIESVGKEIVYAIGTTSGNYVAYGFATKNTQYLNKPRAESEITFRKEHVHIHESLDDFPQKMEYRTIVDLAGWGDSKGICRNVVLTGARDRKNHIWVARTDVGRFNPSEVITLFKAHSRQFSSRILIEEVQYQRAISHFSRLEMETTGEVFSQERLPFDSRANAKHLRIIALEPVVSNGMLHITSSMRLLIEELELYPHSKTVDILDCLGYLYKVTRASGEEVAIKKYEDPLSLDSILKEIDEKSHSHNRYPFDLQLSRDAERIFN